MDLFRPSLFFDLARFEHASLFDMHEPIWEVLKKIGDYLLSSSLGKIEGKIEPGAFLVNPEEISIGRGTIVESGAYIVGPCVIGKNCQVRQGAYLRGNVIAGNKCVLGHATEVKNSIFLDGAQAGHFAYVGDSILGNHVNLGAGTKCANLRFDKKNIHIHWENQIIDTGLRKFGAILGDGAQSGCNSVTNPGTLMGKRCLILPCAVAKGVILEDHGVKTLEEAMVSL